MVLERTEQRWGDFVCVPVATSSWLLLGAHCPRQLQSSSVGLQEGKPLVLDVVKKAEQKLVSDPSRDKEYAGKFGR